MKIIACIPNFSDGRNKNNIEQITKEIQKIGDVKLLDVDSGYETNRTVVTFAGSIEAVKAAAFAAIKKSHELIDMTKHTGTHPRFGSCDVCPIVPVENISMQECIKIAHNLGKHLAEKLDYPVYFYENAATNPKRKNLAWVRQGEYEKLAENLRDPQRIPDAGPSQFRPDVGATAVGARNFLIAYNINLNSKNTRAAKDIALIIREKGYVKRDARHKIVLNKKGEKTIVPGKFKNCKAIGWYVSEYKRTQISINLTDYSVTGLHDVFDEVIKLANKQGIRVTGSEIIGVVPKQALLDAGKHYLIKQGASQGIPEKEIIETAIQSLGLHDVVKFDKNKKIIEYALQENQPKGPINLPIIDFVNELSTDSPAPGGGSVAALCGSVAAALGSMVANLTHNKVGNKKYNKETNELAVEFQKLKEKFLKLIDEDATAFNLFILAARNKNTIKKGNDKNKIHSDYIKALEMITNIPLNIMHLTENTLPLLKKLTKIGNRNALSDIGVAVANIKASVDSAYLNVLINLMQFEDQNCDFVIDTRKDIEKVRNNVREDCEKMIEDIRKLVISA